MLTDVGPVELWGTRPRRPRAAANPRVLLAACPSLNRIRGSSPLRTAALMPAEPHIRSPLQSGYTIIPHSKGHRVRESGSTLYFGIPQPLFATGRPPGSNGADQARGGTRDNDSGRREYLSLPSCQDPPGAHHV